MPRFKIKHGLYLQSAQKLLQPGQYFTATDEQAEELRKVFLKDGACEEIVSKPEPKKEEGPAKPPENPSDDITLAPVGKTVLEKLAKEGITTLSHLKSALEDASKLEHMKKLLGTGYEKVRKYFVDAK